MRLFDYETTIRIYGVGKTAVEYESELAYASLVVDDLDMLIKPVTIETTFKTHNLVTNDFSKDFVSIVVSDTDPKYTVHTSVNANTTTDDDNGFNVTAFNEKQSYSVMLTKESEIKVNGCAR